MKIAIPTMDMAGMDAIVGQHFGSSPAYTLYDTETKIAESVANTSRHAGGQGYPPEILRAMGVDMLICKGLGIKALEMFTELGITVLTGAQQTVKETIDMWEAGALSEASKDSACKGHH